MHRHSYRSHEVDPESKPRGLKGDELPDEPIYIETHDSAEWEPEVTPEQKERIKRQEA